MSPGRCLSSELGLCHHCVGHDSVFDTLQGFLAAHTRAAGLSSNNTRGRIGNMAIAMLFHCVLIIIYCCIFICTNNELFHLASHLGFLSKVSRFESVDAIMLELPSTPPSCLTAALPSVSTELMSLRSSPPVQARCMKPSRAFKRRGESQSERS